jgi:hypothetical protein
LILDIKLKKKTYTKIKKKIKLKSNFYLNLVTSLFLKVFLYKNLWLRRENIQKQKKIEIQEIIEIHLTI